MAKTPRATIATIAIPADATFEKIEGDKFVTIAKAARLGGVHPVVLEMGQQLLKNIGGAGAAFALGTPAMVSKAADIEKVFRTGLKRVAKALDPNHKVKVKSHRDGARIVFWFVA